MNAQIEAGQKTCAMGGETRPLTDFAISNKSKDGRASSCLECRSKYAKATYAKTKDRRAAQAE